ncbi:FG-GAP-like repeat-containing protein [Limnoglobus roseus]|uniref:VCBS repeat-containing protein n=1 Tax=Limnoglobus roseus TaxID=2598579 RepID=A0A5C1AH03_9BACT|nr:FG-GAP-like repeat-containing protein [Limnoglobus roseus]QEL17266.1 VCBS repeat-containing protein [Limnoglobus roseus]
MSERSNQSDRWAVVELEDRTTPSITLRVDYTYDTNNFFTPDRRVAIERVAAEVGSHLQDTLAAIVPSGGNTWQASFFNTITNRTVTLNNPTVAANEIIVYVAGGPIGSSELGVASGGSYQAEGGRTWLNNVKARGQAGALGNTPTDISPWGGFIAFDSGTPWDFTTDAPGFNVFDFDSVARHEMLHVIGFGLGDYAFDRYIVNGAFTGPNAVAAYGQAVPMAAGDDGHWASGVTVGDQVAIMVPSIPAGVIRQITPLDYAALADIGWQVSEPVSPPPVVVVPPPPPPPPPPPAPPVVPPPPATVNAVVRFAVGSGEGVASTVSAVNSNGEPVWTLTPFGDSTGGVRTASGDFDKDGVKDVVVGTGPGVPTQVRIFSGETQKELFSISPFEAAFTGGVYVTVGDINGDGVPELVITPDEGGGPRARVFDGATFNLIDDFFGIDDPNFRGGARAAVGDLNGDGHGDLLVAAGFGGGPRVAGYDGTTLGTTQRQKLFGDFFAFEQTLRNGVFLAAGDFNNDGQADLVAGGGPGGGPRVLILNGSSLLRNSIRTLSNFFAGDTSGRGGVRVTTDDVNGDGRPDLITGSGSGDGSRVTVYNGTAVGLPFPSTLFDGDFYPGFSGGVFVG